ncbi:MAG: hypothetical protein LJE93_00125 [Acidobacteria bacterium]|jgi:hypothetical protein|nr:hypothetical protein [Acidobacteriota bacterium]
MGTVPRYVALATTIVVLTAGCTSFGPEVVERDNFDYADAMREAWKEQMLFNMVGLRYAEPPQFLRVTSVINQYSIDGRLTAASPPYSGSGPAAPPLSATAGYADRPTITYAPMTGADFTRSVMTPIPPSTVMSMIQAGWRAETVLRLGVRAINGVYAADLVGRPSSRAEYYEMVLLMQKLQTSGNLAFRVRKTASGDVTLLIVRSPATEELELTMARLGEILGLDPKLNEYRLVFGHQSSGGNEVAVLSKSILEMLLDLSMWIDVPPEHVESGRTTPSPETTLEEDLGFERMITVHSSSEKPDEAYTMVEYHNRWFWIDETDFASKKTLAFMQLLFSLAESGASAEVPTVTVDAG